MAPPQQTAAHPAGGPAAPTVARQGTAVQGPRSLASPETERLYADDLASDGFVMNLTRIRAHQPGLNDRVQALLRESAAAAGLSVRDRGVLVVACASARGDS